MSYNVTQDYWTYIDGEDVLSLHVGSCAVPGNPLLSLTKSLVLKCNFGSPVMEKIPGLYAQIQHDILQAGKTHVQMELQERRGIQESEGLAQGVSDASVPTHGITASSGLADHHLD